LVAPLIGAQPEPFKELSHWNENVPLPPDGVCPVNKEGVAPAQIVCGPLISMFESVP
jgi:hypothetical protein